MLYNESRGVACFDGKCCPVPVNHCSTLHTRAAAGQRGARRCQRAVPAALLRRGAAVPVRRAVHAQGAAPLLAGVWPAPRPGRAPHMHADACVPGCARMHATSASQRRAAHHATVKTFLFVPWCYWHALMRRHSYPSAPPAGRSRPRPAGREHVQGAEPGGLCGVPRTEQHPRARLPWRRAAAGRARGEPARRRTGASSACGLPIRHSEETLMGHQATFGCRSQASSSSYEHDALEASTKYFIWARNECTYH